MSAHAARLRDVSSISHPTRRAVLVGAGAVLAAGSVSGCVPLGNSDRDDSDAPDPDLQRVQAMVSQIGELQALIAATSLAHPRLVTRLAALSECHAAHLRVLATDADSAPTPSPSPPTPGPATPSPAPAAPTARAALTRLRSTEEAHVSALTSSAAMSQSGALARLFAVMAAGVGQHLAALSETSGTDGAGES